MVRIHVSGDGRMGAAVLRLIEADKGLRAVRSVMEADVVLDYSHPDWTGPLLDGLLMTPRPLVLGTTGLDRLMEVSLQRLSADVPVVRAPNTGTGIAVLRGLVKTATAALGEGWDVEILEMHHRKKVDAPSGTAWLLLDAATEGLGGEGRERAVPARVGQTGARTDSEIGIQTLRGGDVIGEHTVYLVGHGERLELTHRCWDRDTFARGGLRAAAWAAEPDRAPGRYSMNDVLGL